MKVLIVEDDYSSRSYLMAAVESQGYEVQVAEDGKSGLEVFKKFQPDLVLSDIRMPVMDGLELLAEIRKINSHAIVVMMTGFGSETYAVEALRLRANNYLQKPLRNKNLLALLKKYQATIESKEFEAVSPELTLQRSMTLSFGNDRKLIPQIARYLIREINGIVDQEILLGLRLGLIELLINAMEHGNLGITFEEKSEVMETGGIEGIDKLSDERLSDPERSKRCVTVEFHQVNDYVEWLISDEGDGFDHESVMSQTGGNKVFSMHGRGIFLSRFQFDEIEYIGKGNVVRARKNLEPDNK